jgi:hypothetical protein
MKQSRIAVGALAIAVLAGGGALEAQETLPLTPLAPSGDIVAPFFDGWYRNPDGSYTLSFGFFNRNTEEVVEIPIGPDNRLEPEEFNGLQPTYFPPVSYGGFSGRRERGAFAVTVPADFGDREVVWTIRHRGKTNSVPGRVTSPAYELGYAPMAAGSLAPTITFDQNAPAVSGRGGVVVERSVRVGEALPLTIWAYDQGERERRFPVTVTWVKHQGPGTITFDPESSRAEEPGGELNTTATFSAPGEYLIRARVDNFTASDSSFADQCCWSNGFVRVTVTP